jgi:hypothetical protein
MLKQIAVDKKDFFDNAIIIIDEVHNLTRLMRGKLDKYLRNIQQEQATGASSIKLAPGKKPKKLQASYEPITPDVWEPKLRGSSQKYERAFLFYRLLVQARNSKIIALSGTPIVNFPEEVGILANILHGYFNACEVRIRISSDKQEEQSTLIKNILKFNNRVGFYALEQSTTDTKIFFTVLHEGYVKHIEENILKGIVQISDESGRKPVQQVFEELKTELTTALPSAKFTTNPSFVSLPLLPPTVDAFRAYFVDVDTLKMKNPVLFMKRISGLVSYYKGAKEELMPAVVKDEIVKVYMSAYSLGPYAEARARERKDEERLKKSKNLVQIADDLASSESVATSYRFRSRAACNFVFPEDIPRPFPTNIKQMKKEAKVEEIVLGDNDGDIQDDDNASVLIEDDEEDDGEELVSESIAIETQEDEKKNQEANSTATPLKVTNPKIPKEVYEYAKKIVSKTVSDDDRITYALKALAAAAPVLFKLKPVADARNLSTTLATAAIAALTTTSDEEESLMKYSPKFVAILEKIRDSKGSSLVYSQFRTLEGIGILGICLEANGFAPIKLTGPDTDLAFSQETEKSLLERPDQFRYIIYSGGESKVMRQTLINIFNMRIDKLPSKISAVLEKSTVKTTKNLKGEVCRVFMITGAGAEGLSLRSVRTVHILEPYWNKVRTDQVKGRAVRICSHSDLPYNADPALNERTVEIFSYLSSFSPDMIKDRKIDTTLLIQDDGKTTDEHVHSINVVKDTISTDFIGSMKSAAVDCILNLPENDSIQCFVQEGKIDDFLYDPRIEVDREQTERQTRVEKRPLLAVPTIALATDADKKSDQTQQQQAQQTQQKPPSYPVIKLKSTGLEYMRVPKVNSEGKSYDGLFALTDRRLTKELGRIIIGADKKPKVEMFKV